MFLRSFTTMSYEQRGISIGVLYMCTISIINKNYKTKTTEVVCLQAEAC